MQKEELYKILDERGVRYDKRWNVNKLAELVYDFDVAHGNNPATGIKEIIADPVSPEDKKIIPLKVVATFKTRTIDGDRIKHKYVGSGTTPEEALDVKCEDPEETEGQAWPKGCNCLVTMKVTQGEYVYERNLAQHVTRAILENRNVALFKKLLGV